MATTPTQPVLEQISPKATYYVAGVTAGVGAGGPGANGGGGVTVEEAKDRR